MASLFNAKHFNSEVVLESVGNIRSETKLELVRLAKRSVNAELPSRMPDQKGGNIATIIIHGNLGGESENYDGDTDISVGSLTNYSQTVVAIGRAHAWGEEDFQTSIAGYSELDAQIYQLAIYQDKQVKAAVLSTLKGIFASALSGKVKSASTVSEDSLIDLLVESAGDMADEFDTVVMDSYVAGELAKKSLLAYGKYVVNGIEYQDQKVGFWAGKRVIIDDAVGTNAKVGTHKVYAFAPYSFEYSELPVKTPFELTRDPLRDGGIDIVVERQRFVLAPYGVSFTSASMAKLSPTNAELETGSNWAKVHDGQSTPVAIEDKVIPFACLSITISE